MALAFPLAPAPPAAPPAASLPLLPPTDIVEEEQNQHYNPYHFYPVRLHTTLVDKYVVAAKLGWGTSSTVWLARDISG